MIPGPRLPRQPPSDPGIQRVPRTILLLLLAQGSLGCHAPNKKTMSDLNLIQAGLRYYAEDHGRYPTGSTIEELAQALEPDYLVKVPRTDDWGTPLKYECGSRLTRSLLAGECRR